MKVSLSQSQYLEIHVGYHRCKWYIYDYVLMFCIQLDIDECATENGGCEVQCTDTNGSFACSCGTGYHLGDDGKSCDGEDYAWSRETHACMLHYL